ncbi:unnamed protein product, partial [Symbiodinium sp. KB8]
SIRLSLSPWLRTARGDISGAGKLLVEVHPDTEVVALCPLAEDLPQRLADALLRAKPSEFAHLAKAKARADQESAELGEKQNNAVESGYFTRETTKTGSPGAVAMPAPHAFYGYYGGLANSTLRPKEALTLRYSVKGADGLVYTPYQRGLDPPSMLAGILARPANISPPKGRHPREDLLDDVRLRLFRQTDDILLLPPDCKEFNSP